MFGRTKIFQLIEIIAGGSRTLRLMLVQLRQRFFDRVEIGKRVKFFGRYDPHAG